MVERFRLTRPAGSLEIEVCWTGQSPDGLSSYKPLAAAHWEPQEGSDLGERLERSVARAFESNAKRVVVIGTDCPDLDAAGLPRAFESLAKLDVVLGPATDGGYYLIGLSQNAPALFRGIDWSTERVLAQTLMICQRERLSVAQLPELSDVDQPEDLLHLRRLGIGTVHDGLPRQVRDRISIIIPTLNEERSLPSALAPLIGREGIEVIVADGSSTDRTADIACESGVRLVTTQRGRGRQLNAGAAVASGEVLLFLHADSRLPEQFEAQIWSTLNKGQLAGAFRLRIDAPGWGVRCVEWGANLRSKWRQLTYGDQGFFMRATDFYQMGGYRNWPLMEDYELCGRLRTMGGVGLASGSVTTSARRWSRYGAFRNTLINQVCIAAYRLGVPPASIANWYYGKR